MLVVVEDRDIQFLLQTALDLKAGRRGDVLQVDAAEHRGQQPHGLDDFFGIVGVQADGEGVHTAEFLEQNGLALHHRLGGGGADVAQAQHSGAVGHHSHQVALGGIGVGGGGVLGDLPAGLGHAGGIGGGEVLPGLYRNLADDLDLSLVLLVQFQSHFVVIHLLSPSFA